MRRVVSRATEKRTKASRRRRSGSCCARRIAQRALTAATTRRDDRLLPKKQGGPFHAERLPLVMSTCALLVAVFGATPLGHAAGRAIHTVPPFATRAGFAKLAGTADNSKRLAGHKPSLVGAAGTIPVVGANGKLPASIGAVGPQGPPGSKGDTGAKGAPGARRARRERAATRS